MDDTRVAPAAPAAPLRATQRRSPWLVPALLVLILMFLTANVLAHSPLLDVDRWIRSAVQAQALSPRFRWLEATQRSPVNLIADLGDNQVAVPVLILSALVTCAGCRSVRPLLAAVIGLVLLLGTVIPAKILIGRAGPGLPPVAHGALGVFPSGHSATSGVCLGLAAALLAAGLPGWGGRFVLAGMAVVCFLVGAALIWGDYHWFTDVIGGWALAALIVMATLRVTGLSGNSSGRAHAVRGGAATANTHMSREQADDSART